MRLAASEKLRISRRKNKFWSIFWAIITVSIFILMIGGSICWEWMYYDEIFNNPHRLPAEIKNDIWNRIFGL
jgi:hypothetical protein